MIKKIFIIFKDYYLKSWFFIIVFTILAFLCYGVIVCTPLVSAKIIDSAVYYSGMSPFLKYIFIGIILQIVFAIIMPIKHYLELKIKTEATAQQKERIISRIPILKHESLKKSSIGNLLQLVDNDLESIGSLVISDFVTLLTQIIYFIVILTIVIRINITLSLVMLCISPSLVFFSKVLIPKIQKYWHELIHINEQINDLTDEIYKGSMTIKMANSYLFIYNKIKNIVTTYTNTLMKYNRVSVIHYHLLTASFMNIGQLMITIIGAYMVIKGIITIGTMGIIGAYFSGLWGVFNYFIGFWTSVKQKMISLDRILNFLNLPTELENGIVADDFFSIHINDVSYCVENQEILNGVKLEICRGDKILISGDNGSGKSTLVRLLVGLMTPTNGIITYNEKNIFHYNIHTLREKVCYIPSEPYIFSGHLEDNFFGKNIKNNLLQTDKYKNISKEGNNLSSGEKKKLQLISGMLSDSDIYILD
jgi:ABC-type bacteriocin/lantibiotic exporter with double-glycine peptidase domain